jgi:hypothetical protein
MANKHVKVINGKKYYYESIRRGKKVTSKYLGPVEPKKKRKEAEKEDSEETTAEEDYIG